MCHLILFLPVLVLPLFWWLPVEVAVPAYLVVLLLSAVTYYYVYLASHRQVETGIEELLASTGEVVWLDGEVVTVKIHSENWFATSKDRLSAGDRVKVSGIDGLRLVVERL